MTEYRGKAAAKDGDDQISRARERIAEPSSTPNIIFVHEWAINEYGLLNAAILGEFLYWFAIGKKKFFRRTEDHAKLFQLSKSAIGDRHKALHDAGILSRKRPYSKKHGGQLAYDYWLNQTNEADFLLSEYRGILCKESNRGISDFGTPNFEENEAKTALVKPKIVTVFTSVVYYLNDFTTAYLYCFLLWISNNKDYETGLRLNNKSHLARLTNLKRATADRRLKKLRELDLLSYRECEYNEVEITFNRNVTFYKEYSDYHDKVFLERKDGMFQLLDDRGEFDGYYASTAQEGDAWEDYI